MSVDDFNLYARFRAAYAGRSDEPMLFAGDGRALCFRDLDALSARLAHCLEGAGVAPGDRVSAQLEKSPEGLCLYLACLRAGFVFHPLNLGYKRAELEYFVGNAEPAVIVCDPRGEATLGELGRAAGVGRLFTLAGDGGGSLLEEAAGRDPGFDTRPADRDQLAALLYSSGTTGVPKGIMLSYGNLVASTETLVRALGLQRGGPAAPRAAHLPRARPLRRHRLRPGQRRQHALAHPLRRQAGDRESPRVLGDDGGAHLLHAAAGRGGVRRPGLRRNAPVRVGVGAAAGGDFPRVRGANRPRASWSATA